jgi:hypothetical protein
MASHIKFADCTDISGGCERSTSMDVGVLKLWIAPSSHYRHEQINTFTEEAIELYPVTTIEEPAFDS